jgi:acyl carrier protein
MTIYEIETKIFNIVCEELRVDEDTIGILAITTTMEGLGADSYDIERLFMRFEKEFQIKMLDYKHSRMEYLQDVIDYIIDLKN